MMYYVYYNVIIMFVKYVYRNRAPQPGAEPTEIIILMIILMMINDNDSNNDN